MALRLGRKVDADSDESMDFRYLLVPVRFTD